MTVTVDRPDVLFSEEQIRQRLGELGAAISAAYPEGQLYIVGRMKSCLVFMAARRQELF